MGHDKMFLHYRTSKGINKTFFCIKTVDVENNCSEKEHLILSPLVRKLLLTRHG